MWFVIYKQLSSFLSIYFKTRVYSRVSSKVILCLRIASYWIRLFLSYRYHCWHSELEFNFALVNNWMYNVHSFSLIIFAKSAASLRFEYITFLMHCHKIEAISHWVSITSVYRPIDIEPHVSYTFSVQTPTSVYSYFNFKCLVFQNWSFLNCKSFNFYSFSSQNQTK